MRDMTDKTTGNRPEGEKTITEEIKAKKDILEKAKKKAASLLEDTEDVLEKPKEAVKEQYRKAARAAIAKKPAAEHPEEEKDLTKEVLGPSETISLKDEIAAVISAADEEERAEFEGHVSAVVNRLRNEIALGCRAEMAKERKKDVAKIRWIVTAGVFFACLTLYTTAMSLNSLGWLNNLDSSVRNMQQLMLQENNAVHNRIREFDRELGTVKSREESGKRIIPDKIPGIPLFGKKTAGTRVLPVITESPLPAQQRPDRSSVADMFRTEVLGKNRAAEQQALEQAAAEQAAEQQNMAARQMMAEKERVLRETNAEENAAELAVVQQARQIAGITYDMYIKAPLGDRLNILATHFTTNIVLMEYMLKTMAANSGVKGQLITQEQVEANLRAILQTEAGRKMQTAYAVWETLKDDHQSLAEIDRRLVENRFYGLPFIAAVENAIIQ